MGLIDSFLGTSQPTYTEAPTTGGTTGNANDPNRVVTFDSVQKQSLLDNTGFTAAGRAVVFSVPGPTVAQLLAAYQAGDIDEELLLLAGITVPADGGKVVEEHDITNPILPVIAGGGAAEHQAVNGAPIQIDVPEGRRVRCYAGHPVLVGSGSTFPAGMALQVNITSAVTDNADGSTTVTFTPVWVRLIDLAAGAAAAAAGQVRVTLRFETYAV